MSDTQANRNALIIAQLKGDFIAFLFVLWKALGLPKPTKCQIDMSRTLADGNNKKFILQAFRGIGKSFITCAFVVWTLWRNPQLKILIVSASKERADKITSTGSNTTKTTSNRFPIMSTTLFTNQVCAIFSSFLIRPSSVILSMFTKLNILIIIRTITILQFIRGVSRLN